MDHIAAFRFIYVGIFAFLALSVVTLEVTESLLQGHFRRVVAEAVQVSPADGPIVPQIQDQLAEALASPWVRLAGVRVNALVLGADGRTPIQLCIEETQTSLI